VKLYGLGVHGNGPCAKLDVVGGFVHRLERLVRELQAQAGLPNTCNNRQFVTIVET
jgi:hypothetical protein